jgi:hypothetical protein
MNSCFAQIVGTSACLFVLKSVQTTIYLSFRKETFPTPPSWIAPPTTTQPSSALASHQETYKWTWGPGADQSFTIDVVAAPLPAALSLFATGLGVLGLLGWRRKLLSDEELSRLHPARAVRCSRIFHKSAGMYIERNMGLRPLQSHVGTSLRWSSLKGRFTRLDWEGPVWRRSRLFWDLCFPTAETNLSLLIFAAMARAQPRSQPPEVNPLWRTGLSGRQ